MKKSFVIIIGIMGLLLTSRVEAQDVHFSHIHASPLTLNPALAGVFDGNLRFITNYRQQWESVTANYRTFMASGDANFRGPNQSSIIGLGVMVYSDVAGDLNFRTNSASASLSFIQALNGDGSHIIAGGFQIGQVSSRFDAANIISHEEEPIGALDGTSQTSYYDMSAGVLWMKKYKDKKYIYLGGSMYHINNPIVSFNNDPEDNSLYRRYVVHGGASLSLSDFLSIQPNFLYMNQGPHQQFTFGSFLKFENPHEVKKTSSSFMLGAWARSFSLEDRIGADAIVTAFRIDQGGLIFTFTYDINVSSLARATFGRGGPEISLVYIIGKGKNPAISNLPREGSRPKKHKWKCPVNF